MNDLETLRSAILSLDGPVFAVLDGAQFEDLPEALFAGDFLCRSLYLHRGDGTADRMRTAPQLVQLAGTRRTASPTSPTVDPDTIDALFALCGTKACAVFWRCAGGESALYRHLRTVNMIRIPRPNDAGSTPPDETPTGDAIETVLFRHADANVMAQVLPHLSSANQARLLGPAQEIFFRPDPEWAPRPMRLARSRDLPSAQPGLMQLSPGELSAIEACRQTHSQCKIESYIRRNMPDHCASMGDEELRARVNLYRDEAARYGVRSEGSQGRWVYLQLMTGGQLRNNDHFEPFMTRPHSWRSADNRIDLVMRAVTRELRRGGR